MDDFQSLSLPEDGPKFSSEARLHEHVEILPVLEGLVEFDYESAVRLFHDLLLRHDVLLLARLNDLKNEKINFNCLVGSQFQF